MKVTKEVHTNGDIYYHNEHGQFHREDGPAVIYPNGFKSYWLNDKCYSYEDWLELVKDPIVRKWREFCEVN